MSLPKDIARIQACISNSLDHDSIGNKQITGVIGDTPSTYSKSPALWNGAFRALRLGIAYLPFDVHESRLPTLARALRESDRVMGVSVTVPYKTKIMEHLDELDAKAKQIKAVNTIVRTGDGRLVGYNTDGKGLLESILRTQPGQARPFMETLSGIDVLLIGAGGAARSVAFYLAEALKKGGLIICNRTPRSAIEEDEIGRWAPKAGLILNCSTKGQGGIRKTTDGKIMILEPYSALAPANPVALEESEPEFHRNWLRASLADIEANNRASWNLALSIPRETGFCDLIYHPEETVFLRHGRLSGHRSLNGKGMLIAQAADALFDKICREHLHKAGLDNPSTYQRVLETMYQSW
ncbi:MAG: hypothetical protein HYV05_01670 [Deltaproteobacteria bacterium]|nr:hypothetical protein [Deltaproteobacteria bacterium]